MTLDLPDLDGQHRVGGPAETSRVAAARVDLDDLEVVAEPLLKRGEPLGRRHRVTGEPQAQGTQALVGGAFLDDRHLPFGDPGSRFIAGVRANGTDGWLSTGASTLSSTAAASAKPPEKHWPITPTPLPGVAAFQIRASARG